MILFKIYCFYSLPNEIKMYGISIVMNEIERVHQIKIKIKNEIESSTYYLDLGLGFMLGVIYLSAKMKYLRFPSLDFRPII